MNKALLIFFLVAVIIGSLALAGNLHFDTAQGATQVSGIVSSDTTWTKANSPYNLTGNVLVDTGVTLTIEPGVTVYFNGYYLMVNGTLNARGNTNDKITLICNGTSHDNPAILFTSNSIGWSPQTNSGSIIENTIINSTWYTTIKVSSSSPKINNDIINGNGDIPLGGTAIDVGGGTPIISNSSLFGACGKTMGYNGIGLNSANASICDNVIYGCGFGIDTYLDNNSSIQRNLIINNSIGITINDWDPHPVLLENNTIIKNSIGLNIVGITNPTIIHNNVENNNQYNVHLEPHMLFSGSSNINAAYNWWGTTDAEAINRSIYDFYDDFNLGTVTFSPFLTEPNPEAPTIPTFTISAFAGEGGSISPSGSTIVNFTDSQTFTITANTGYHIVDVTVDGSSIGAVGSYIFTNVVAAHTISATFASTPTPTPTATPTPPPTPTPTPSTSPSPTPTASPSVTPTPSQEPTSTPKPQQQEPFPTTLVIASVASAAVVGIGLLVYFKKRKR